MENIKYAIFDMDGTLTETMEIWDTVAGAFLMMRGIKPDDENVFREWGYSQGINYIIKKYNLPLSYDEVMEQMIKILEYFYFNVAEAKPGVKDFLQSLKDNGVKMCIVSATNQYLVEACLKRNGLYDYFCKIYSTHEIGIHKDNRKIFDMASEFLGADGDVFVFEDAVYAIRTAKEAGYKVVAVEDYSAEAHRDEIKEFSDYYITDYKQMYDIFNLR